MSKQLRELQAPKTTLVKDARGLTDLAASESRDLTDDEVTAFCDRQVYALMPSSEHWLA